MFRFDVTFDEAKWSICFVYYKVKQSKTEWSNNIKSLKWIIYYGQGFVCHRISQTLSLTRVHPKEDSASDHVMYVQDTLTGQLWAATPSRCVVNQHPWRHIRNQNHQVGFALFFICITIDCCLAIRICAYTCKSSPKRNQLALGILWWHIFGITSGIQYFLSLRCKSKKYNTDLRRMYYISSKKSPWWYAQSFRCFHRP